MIYVFQNYTLDTEQFRLSSSGVDVAIEPQVFDLLLYLIEYRDRVVAREELLGNLWKGKVVTDSALAARIKAARKAVGDDGNAQSVIKTFHGRGYQFVGKLELPTGSSIAPIDVPHPELPDVPSIAVLPFTNLSGDPDQNYFADGLVEDIVSSLSKLHDLFVVSHYSTLKYKNQSTDIKQIGKEQGVSNVLVGSVRKSGNRLRVTVQLSNTTTGEQVWSEQYDRELNDIFAVQDEITHNVTVEMRAELKQGEEAPNNQRRHHQLSRMGVDHTRT